MVVYGILLWIELLLPLHLLSEVACRVGLAHRFFEFGSFDQGARIARVDQLLLTAILLQVVVLIREERAFRRVYDMFLLLLFPEEGLECNFARWHHLQFEVIDAFLLDSELRRCLFELGKKASVISSL